jgi:hypothetical protein
VTAAAEQTARDRQDSPRDEFADRRDPTQATQRTNPATHRNRKTDRRQAPKPALPEPIDVKKFFANRKGDIIVIALRQLEGGPPFLDIRKFFTDENGVMRPTKKGVSVAIIRAPDLCDGVTKAVKVAQQLGLLK